MIKYSGTILCISTFIFSTIFSSEKTTNLHDFFPKFNLQNNQQIQGNHGQQEEAFVTFATADYFEILEVLLDSVHSFSSRPIIAYGINADIPFSQEKYPRLIKRRFNTQNMYAKRPYIFFFKFAIILDSNIKNGIYVEADDIVNYKIDDLFAECKNVHQFPLCPVHPDNPDDQGFIMKQLNVSEKTNPYVHGHIVFSTECMPFIHECYQTCLTYGSQIKGNWDETVLNVMLWKYKVKNHYLPMYDLFCTAYQNYIEQSRLNMRLTVATPIYYYMFHGAKNPTFARHILTELKNNVGKSIKADAHITLKSTSR